LAETEKLAEFEMRVGPWIWVRPERRETMEVEKIRNLNDDELALEGRKAAEALFRLRFQMKLGQTEGVKKLRELRKDVARINTIERERVLGIHTTVASKHAAHAETAEEHEASAPAKQVKPKAAKPAKKKAAKSAAPAHKSSGRTAAARKSAAKPSASKKTASRSTSVKKG
jgi:large subunit ribosomal protein L29